jgi:hypothetical protein
MGVKAVSNEDAHPPEYWLSLTNEALRSAELLTDAECKRMLYTVAAAYERIAQTAPHLRQANELAAAVVPNMLGPDDLRGAELAGRHGQAAADTPSQG